MRPKEHFRISSTTRVHVVQVFGFAGELYIAGCKYSNHSVWVPQISLQSTQ